MRPHAALLNSPGAWSRFWSKVAVGSGCWLWNGSRLKSGYGRFMCRGRVRMAHRMVAEWVYGPLRSRWALHSCDNPPCVRPSHLRVGTRADNMRDMAAKGRARCSKKALCPAGHPFDALNSQGRRICRQCRRRYCRIWWRQKHGKRGYGRERCA